MTANEPVVNVTRQGDHLYLEASGEGYGRAWLTVEQWEAVERQANAVTRAIRMDADPEFRKAMTVCRICGAALTGPLDHAEPLSRDQWYKHYEVAYEEARGHGAPKHEADSFAARDTTEFYSPEPADPGAPQARSIPDGQGPLAHDWFFPYDSHPGARECSRCGAHDDSQPCR